WNYCNELSVKVWERERRLLSGYDFHPFTKGAGKAGLGLHSGTVQAVAEEYATRRKQARKVKLRWRACDCAGVWFDEVDEAYSTATCSCCKRRTGPKGLEGLRIRERACLECGAYHHRDINSAENILAAGRRRLAVGIPVLPAPCAAAAG
ncbi:zinc ribbon domain-containing protein, partial [Paraburkholderia sp.]|uniref:zinc ribbon domain-containing protein n=1 Tax=Paraburkholderia sp. TaxID=1926495 RepID=UPI003C7B1CD9